VSEIAGLLALKGRDVTVAGRVRVSGPPG